MSKKKKQKERIDPKPDNPIDEFGFTLGDAQMRIEELDEIVHDLLEKNLRLEKELKNERAISDYYSEHAKIRWHKDELSACPFCGSSQAKFVTIPSTKNECLIGFIRCGACRAQGGAVYRESSDCDIDELKEDAAELWNVRCFDEVRGD